MYRRCARPIERLSLTDAVQLMGVVDEETLLAYYASADVFCLPTLQVNDDFEGFGLVYLGSGSGRFAGHRHRRRGRGGCS